MSLFVGGFSGAATWFCIFLSQGANNSEGARMAWMVMFYPSLLFAILFFLLVLPFIFNLTAASTITVHRVYTEGSQRYGYVCIVEGTNGQRFSLDLSEREKIHIDETITFHYVAMMPPMSWLSKKRDVLDYLKIQSRDK